MAVNRRVVPPTAACSDPHQSFDSAARRLYPVRLGRREPARQPIDRRRFLHGLRRHQLPLTLVSGDEPDDRLAPALDEGALLVHAQESELLVMGAGSRTAMLDKIADLTKAAAASAWPSWPTSPPK
jgi:enediyne polyketide synthase